MARIVELTGLGKYHEKIKALIEKLKYIHPANHPATMIIQDSNNQFVTKDQKTNWTNKLDADANAVSASKLNKPVKINGVEFDGTKDINFDISSAYVEKSYVSILPPKTEIINVPEQYWISDDTILLYVNGIKLINEKNFIINKETKTITLNEAYEYQVDIEVLFNCLDTSNMFVYELEPNINEVVIETTKNIGEESTIYVFVDGIKLIKNKHYNINYETKTLILNENYENKIDVEVLILKV